MNPRSPLLLASALLSSAVALAAQTPTDPLPTPTRPFGRLRPPPAPDFGTDRLMSSAVSLTYATGAPGDTDRLFVVEQRGRILILDLNTLTVNATPFLDIDSRILSGSERGLLGLAFSPKYENNGLFYVNYSRNGDGATVVAEYSVTANPDVADFNSERIVLTVSQPQSNHNGGWIGFSPLDDFLYVAMGDGGNFCDTGSGHTAGIGNAQDIDANLLGKMLRIDPLGGVPYAVPNTNPFVGILGDDEIWCYGLRNPFRCSFDRDTGDLYMGDVGQDQREEVDYQSFTSLGGENYGWRCKEGINCPNGASGCPSTTGCVCPGANPSLTNPIHDYPQAGVHCSVIGGYVYRGPTFPQLRGHYFFADYCSADVWSFRVDNGVKVDYQERTAKLSPSIDGFNLNLIQSFGEDTAGELYIVTSNAVFKIVPRP